MVCWLLEEPCCYSRERARRRMRRHVTRLLRSLRILTVTTAAPLLFYAAAVARVVPETVLWATVARP